MKRQQRGVGRHPGAIQLRDSRGRLTKTLPVMSLGYARDKAAMHIAEALTRERERFGASAWELAKRLEVSVSTVWGWERGSSCPSVANLLRVAWALGIPVTRLVEDVT